MNMVWRMGWWLAAAVLLAGCEKAATQAESTVAAEPLRVVVPVGAAAFQEVAAFVALGEKRAGEETARAGAEHILARLKALGVAAEQQVFEDETPHGRRSFRNVLARIPGTGDAIVLLAAHYDTKGGIDGFVGANDSGSGVGLLLALADALMRQGPLPFEVRLAFFDGEECAVRYGPQDGLHGSRHLADAWAESGELQRVRVMVLLDMVGDRDLRITLPSNGSPKYASQIFEAARQEGVRNHFGLLGGEMLDDHVPFLMKGIPAVDLIDFTYGSAPGKNDYWHTPADTLDKLSAESLEIVGRVVQRFLFNLAATD